MSGTQKVHNVCLECVVIPFEGTTVLSASVPVTLKVHKLDKKDDQASGVSVFFVFFFLNPRAYRPDHAVIPLRIFFFSVP